MNLLGVAALHTNYAVPTFFASCMEQRSCGCSFLIGGGLLLS